MISLILGRTIAGTAVVGLFVLLSGVFLAHWQGTFHWHGFLWSAFGTVMNGILYELFAKTAKETTAFEKCFWACVGTAALGLVLGTAHSLNGGVGYVESWTTVLDAGSGMNDLSRVASEMFDQP